MKNVNPSSGKVLKERAGLVKNLAGKCYLYR